MESEAGSKNDDGGGGGRGRGRGRGSGLAEDEEGEVVTLTASGATSLLGSKTSPRSAGNGGAGACGSHECLLGRQ